MKFLVLVLLVLLVGCAGKRQDFVTGEWNPSFEIDDPEDGLFPNKSSRVGENAYTWRSQFGWRRKYQRGHEYYVNTGPRNQHVWQVRAGCEVPIN